MGYYGIDLGTSNCLVAKVVENLDDTFDVKCLVDDNGNSSFPSVVYFEKENEYKVGVSALQNLYNKSSSTVDLIKVRLGKTDSVTIKTDNETFSKAPQEITSYILKHINSIHNNVVNNPVITVPAFFSQSQKEGTMQSGELANINPKLLMEEPTAAIVYHIFSEYKKDNLIFTNDTEKNILVFDFGGGTLDLSLISILKNEDEVIPKVLAIGGDTNLGGSIIDLIFTKYILEFLVDEYAEDDFIQNVSVLYEKCFNHFLEKNVFIFPNNAPEEMKQFIYRLKRNLEEVKIKLSTEDNVTIIFERQYKPLTISRSNFEEGVLESEELNVRDKIEVALNGISKQRKRVDEVLLIGGSAQIPYIKNIIFETFENMGLKSESIILSNDFEQAVAKGAAIQSALKEGVQIPPFMNNKCESIVAREIFIEHADKKETFVEIGTPYPFSEKKEITFKIGNSLSESVSIKLFEVIEKPNQEKMKRLISRIEFYLPIYYTEDDITLRMNINEAGLYQIEAIYESTRESAEFESHKHYALSDVKMKEVSEVIEKAIDIS